jgi:hypothetical protein
MRLVSWSEDDVGMLDVVGDHDGFNDNVGLSLEGFTNEDGPVVGFDDIDGMDDEEDSLDGIDLDVDLSESSLQQMRRA